MKLGLDTIKSLGAQGNSKSAVLKALFATTARQSVLGVYGFDKNGDTTLKSYGLYKVGFQRRARLLQDAHTDEDTLIRKWWRGAHRVPLHVY